MTEEAQHKVYAELRAMAGENPSYPDDIDRAVATLGGLYSEEVRERQFAAEDSVLGSEGPRALDALANLDPKALKLVEARLQELEPPRKLEDLIAELRVREPKAYLEFLRNAGPEYLRDSLAQLSTEERADALKETLQEVRERLESDHSDPSVLRTLEALSDYLGEADLTALGALAGGPVSYRAQQASRLLGGVLASETTTPEQKALALATLIEAGSANLSDETRALMVDQALIINDPEFKAKLLREIVPSSPDIGDELNDIGSIYQSEVREQSLEAYESGDESHPLYKVGQLFHVQALGMEGGEFQGQINQVELGRRLKELMRTEDVQNRTSEISRQVVQEWSNSRSGRRAVDKQVEYLTSEAFQQRLRLLGSEEQRDEAMTRELTPLVLFAPERVDAVADQVYGERLRQIQLRPLENIQNLDAETKTTSLTQVLTEALGDTRRAGTVVKDIVTLLEQMPASATQEQILRHLENFGITNQGGRLTKVLGALALLGLGADLLQGKLPTDDVRTALSQSGELIKISATFARPATGWIAFATGVRSPINLRSMPKTFGLVSAAKAWSRRAPLVGDALGTITDAMSAYDAFCNGDNAKGATYATAAGFGALAMGFGVTSMTVGASLAWNPFGWAALGAGTVAMVVGYTASQMDGHEERLVKELRLFDPAAAMYHAIDGATTDDGQLIRALRGYSEEEMREIRETYEARYGESLVHAIWGDTSWNYEDALVGLTRGYPPNHNARQDAEDLRKAIKGAGTDDGTLICILTARSPAQLQEIDAEFRKLTGHSLRSWVEGDTSGNYKRTLTSVLRNAGL